MRAWEDEAKCKGMGEVFHPATSEAEAEVAPRAKAVCEGCPSQMPCLAYAMARPGLRGIYAGETTEDRNRRRLVEAVRGRGCGAGPFMARCVLCGGVYSVVAGRLRAHLGEGGWWCVPPHGAHRP